MLEGVSLFGNPIMNEFVVGLSDAAPVFVLSILLSKLQIEKAESDRPATFILRKKIRAVSIFTAIFLAGRYAAYFSGAIQSGIQARPLETFMWTLLMGISIGIAYVILYSNRNERSLKHRAVKFGFLIFGLNWAVFLVFMPLLFSGYIADVLLRIMIDTPLVTISSYLTIIPRGEFTRKINLGET
jgi:magnesium-transporting ATPase (P-type)